MTSNGREGFVEVRFSLVVTFCPLSHMGYSQPNSDFTFFSASSMRERFSGFEKSMNGSLVNSETWTVCSAVAMAVPPRSKNDPFYCACKVGDKRGAKRGINQGQRSEEHTSELQSL